jgi:hypothetical protein
MGVAAVWLAVAVAAADGGAVRVAGAVKAPAAWAPEALLKAFAADVREVEYPLYGKPAKSRAVPLWRLVAAAGPKVVPGRKNHLLAFAVTARAEDGYAVTFGVGELHPDHAAADVWVILDRDGGPLPADERPVRLVVPGDKKLARWVKGVTRLVVSDPTAGD